MKISERQIAIPAPSKGENVFEYLQEEIVKAIPESTQVVRMAVIEATSDQWVVEVGLIFLESEHLNDQWRSLFAFRKRGMENERDFNVALVVPTGINAELGGHAGDAGPAARLFGELSDNLITHPNVVNAADINELPENGLYVEGSLLARLMMGSIGLKPVRGNRLLTILDDHPEKSMVDHAINAVSAARASMGTSCPITTRLETPLEMKSEYADSGRAVGEINGLEGVLDILKEHQGNYDSVAVTSRVQVPKSFHYEYYLGGLVNPWGGVEAMLTHTISTLTGLPSAHAPMMESEEVLNINLGVVDPRMAAEVVSVTYLNCVLKGLQKAPQVIWDAQYQGQQGTLWAEDISLLVIPERSLGLPTLAALEQGIPVIAVKDSSNLMKNELNGIGFGEGMLMFAENYMEAAGMAVALRAGISPESVRRPLQRTRVEPDLKEESAPELNGARRVRSI